MYFRLWRRSFSSYKVSLPGVAVHQLDPSVVPTTSTVTGEELVKYFTEMATIRRIEITADQYYKNKFIRGFCHLCDGQEAISVGMEAGLTWEDPLISAYRIHGQAYMRGITPREIFAEMYGKATGSSKGKGGSMHFYSAKNHFYGGNGIVGAQIPVGAGLAFALKYKQQPNAAFTLFGDGAANQGQLYEALNMARLWQLPAVFVCENNLFGMGTSVTRASGNPELYTRGDNVPGIRVEAQDVLMVKEIVKFAKEWVQTHGPLMLEFRTYRYRGHSMSDPGLSSRDRTEVQDVRDNNDPISKCRQLIEELGAATAAQLKAIEKKIKKEIETAAAEALNDPSPEKTELFTNIYTPETKIYGRNTEFQNSLHKY